MNTVRILMGCLAMILSMNPLSANAQFETDWLRSFASGEGNRMEPISSVINNQGDLVIVGQFRGTVDVDPSPSFFPITTSSPSSERPFIVVYDAGGALIWAQAFNAGSNSRYNDVAVDANDNIYVIGTFGNTFFPDPSDPSNTMTAFEPNESDAMIASYNSNGDYRWAQLLTGPGAESGSSLLIDGMQVITTGAFSQTLDLDPGVGEDLVSTPGALAGGQQIWFSSYTTGTGSYNWGTSVEGTLNFDYPNQLALDNAGNFYVTGKFRGTKDFDPGAGNTATVAVGNDDIFVASYQNDGSFRWVNAMGWTSADAGNDLDWNDGEIAVTGTFRSTVDFDASAGTASLSSNGSDDIFLARYLDDGSYVSAMNIGNNSNDRVFSLDLNNENDAVISGYFTGNVEMNPNGGSIQASTQTTDAFTAVYDTNDELLWYDQVSSSSFAEGISAAFNTANEVYSVGNGQDLLDLNPQGGGLALDFNAVSGANLYVTKHDGMGSFNYGLGVNPLSGGSNATTELAMLSDGSVVSAGYFEGQLFTDEGNTIQSNGSQSAFISLKDASGGEQGLAALSGSNNFQLRGLDVDGDDNIYVFGSYFGDFTYECPGGLATEPANINNLAALILMKLDSDLNLIWKETYLNQNAIQNAYDIEVKDDYLLMAGGFQGNLELDAGTTLSDNGNSDIFLAKLDLNGALLWANSFGSTSNDYAVDIQIGDDQRIYMAAIKRFNVVFDPAGAAPAIPGGGSNDMVIVAYEADGSYRWAHLAGGNGTDITEMKISSNGSLFVLGQFSGTQTFDGSTGSIDLSSGNSSDVFLLKYTVGGDLSSATNVTTSSFKAEAGQMTLQNDVISVSGMVNLTGSLASSDGNTVSYDVLNERTFIAQYDTTGVLNAHLIFSGDIGRNKSLALAQNDNSIVIGGEFEQTMIITDDNGDVTSRSSLGEYDGYVLRFGASLGGCLGDFNGDGEVNTTDLLTLLGDFGCTVNCQADLTDDDQVTVADLLAFLSTIGLPCN